MASGTADPVSTGAYRVPRGAARGEYRERGSRFLALLEPVASESEARTVLERLRREHRDASHHCWALRLGAGALERSSDAGEPAGTAGAPILQVLRGQELGDALLVVARWFGGTKLGRGGLARVYAAAARAALEPCATELRVPTLELELEVEYGALGALERLLHPPAVELLSAEYGERVRVRLRVARAELGCLRERMADLGLKRPGAGGPESA